MSIRSNASVNPTSRELRALVTGGTIIYTLVADRREPSLSTQLLRDALHPVIGLTRRERPIILEAIGFLPDHLHCIMTMPAGDPEFLEHDGVSSRHG